MKIDVTVAAGVCRDGSRIFKMARGVYVTESTKMVCTEMLLPPMVCLTLTKSCNCEKGLTGMILDKSNRPLVKDWLRQLSACRCLRDGIFMFHYQFH